MTTFTTTVRWIDGHTSTISDTVAVLHDDTFWLVQRAHGGERRILRSAVTSIAW